MTTIVTDGKFLIADMRTSGAPPRYHKARAFSQVEMDRLRRDTACKIVTPEHVTLGRHKVLAYACTGMVGLQAFFDNVAISREPIDLLKTAKLLDKHPMGCGDLLRIVALTNDGKVHSILLDEHMHLARIVHTIQEVKDQPLAFGSGANGFNALSAYLARRLTPLEVFHFCAHTDASSCNNYSVYSVDAHEHYVVVLPGEEEIKECVRAVQGAFNFYNPSLKPTGSPLAIKKVRDKPTVTGGTLVD